MPLKLVPSVKKSGLVAIVAAVVAKKRAVSVNVLPLPFRRASAFVAVVAGLGVLAFVAVFGFVFCVNGGLITR